MSSRACPQPRLMCLFCTRLLATVLSELGPEPRDSAVRMEASCVSVQELSVRRGVQPHHHQSQTAPREVTKLPLLQLEAAGMLLTACPFCQSPFTVPACPGELNLPLSLTAVCAPQLIAFPCSLRRGMSLPSWSHFRSSVANSLSGSSKVSSVRTSSGMFIQKKADPVVAAIEQRIAEWTFLPIANQEAMQVGSSARRSVRRTGQCSARQGHTLTVMMRSGGSGGGRHGRKVVLASLLALSCLNYLLPSLVGFFRGNSPVKCNVS